METRDAESLPPPTDRRCLRYRRHPIVTIAAAAAVATKLAHVTNSHTMNITFAALAIFADAAVCECAFVVRSLRLEIHTTIVHHFGPCVLRAQNQLRPVVM